MQEVREKKYYKISEVAEMLSISASTLRFWEGHFTIIKPKRNSKGTRFYTPQDVEIIRMVHFLVKEKGLKLDAAQDEIRHNRDGINKKFEAISRLKKVRNTLQEMIDALHELR